MAERPAFKVKAQSAHERVHIFGRTAGRSGNAAGRPKGALTRATVLLEAVSDADLEAIQAKIIEKAKAGDLAGAKLIFDRLLPPPKSRAIPIELRGIGQWDGSETVLYAYREILAAVTNGDATPEEALQLVSLVEAQRAIVKELRPQAMYPKPTPEQLEERKRQAEEWKRMDETITNRLKPFLQD